MLRSSEAQKNHGGPGQTLSLESLFFEHLPGIGAAGVYGKENYVYITTPSSLRIYDVARKTQPTQISTVRLPSPTDVRVIGDYAYVSYGKMNSEEGGLSVIDISNPRKAWEVGRIKLPHGCISVEVKEDYAYLGGLDAGLFVVNISQKKNPRLVKTVSFPRIPNPKGKLLCTIAGKAGKKFPCMLGRTWWTHVEGNFLYVNDENTGLHILDISFPDEPRELGSFIHPYWPNTTNLGEYAFNDVYLFGSNAFTALDHGGMAVIDVSTNEAPQLRYHYNPWKAYKWAKAPGHMVQITIQNQVAYVTAGESGLYLFDVHDTARPNVLVTYPLPKGLGSSWGLFVDQEILYVTYIQTDPGGNSRGLRGGWEILRLKRNEREANGASIAPR